MEDKVKDIIKRYGSDKSFIVPILQDVQREFNYLPKDALSAVSSNLNVPISRVYEVATFYKAFSLKPKGRHQLTLCMGTACHVRGAARILEAFADALGVQPGETTPDGKFSLERVACLGACGLAPVAMIGEKAYGRLVPEKVKEILAEYN